MKSNATGLGSSFKAVDRCAVLRFIFDLTILMVRRSRSGGTTKNRCPHPQLNLGCRIRSQNRME